MKQMIGYSVPTLCLMFASLCGCVARDSNSVSEVVQKNSLPLSSAKDPNYVYNFFISCDSKSSEAQDAQALYQSKGHEILTLIDFFQTNQSNVQLKMKAAQKYLMGAPVPRCALFGKSVAVGSPEDLWKPTKSWGCSDGIGKSRMFLTTYLASTSVSRETILALYSYDANSNPTSELPKCAGLASESLPKYFPKGLSRMDY